MSEPRLSARPFRPEDAAFCFRVRARAFIVDFIDEVGPEVAALCVNEYMPADYVRMAEEREIFVVECDGEPAGFFMLKRTGRDRAEMVLIYLDHRQRGKGVGSWCMAEMERWIRENWPEVKTLYMDTVIPAASGGFYRKRGFTEVGKGVSVFAGTEVPCVRFEKSLP
jgi:GNAT superfamily N-acetyltransferase